MTKSIRGALALAVLSVGTTTVYADSQVPPVIRNYAAGQHIELEPEIELELYHPSFGNDDPTSACTFTQGKHTVTIQGHRECKFAVGALVKAGFAPGVATVHVQTTMNGVQSPPASIDVTLEHEGGFWGTGVASGLIRTGCNRVTSVSIVKGRLSFLFTVEDPTAYQSRRPEIVDVGTLSVAIQPDGTFHDTVELPAAAFRAAELTLSPERLKEVDHHYYSGVLDTFKAFAAKPTLNITGTVAPNLKHPTRIDFTVVAPADPNSNCDFQFLANGVSRPTGHIQKGGAGDACTRDNDCEKFCKRGTCS